MAKKRGIPKRLYAVFGPDGFLWNVHETLKQAKKDAADLDDTVVVYVRAEKK